MQERRPAGDDLHRACRHAERGEQRQRVALGVEHVDAAAAAPMPALALALGEAAPQRRRRDPLIGLARAEEHLADLEQRDVAEAAPRVALRRRREAGDQARPHVGHVGGDRIGERQRRLAAAEQLGVRLRDERPGHRLVEPERGQRPLGGAGALLQQRQHRRRHAGREPRQRRRGDAVEAGDADDLLDDIGLAVDVGPPVRDDRLPVVEPEAEPARGSPRPRPAARRGR